MKNQIHATLKEKPASSGRCKKLNSCYLFSEALFCDERFERRRWS